MTQFYSRVDTTLNGDVYSIPFSYIKEEEIQVYIGDELYTDWYFLNDSQIKINNLPSDLPSNTIVSVRRLTDISKKEVEYTNNTLLNKENLNLSQDQLLHAVQEIYDNNIQFEIDTLKVIQENKEEVLDTVQENKEEVLGIQQAFEDEVNHKIQEVSDAASKINALEEAVDTAIAAANTASEQASIATDTNQEIIAASEELKDAMDKTVEEINDKITNFDTSLEEKTVELTREADRQINNIQSTGFYMRDDKLYFINSEGEEEEFKSGSGFNLFDTKISDRILQGEEALGWAMQGTYVSGALYPDFYNKCLEEKNSGVETETTLGDSVLTMFVNANGHQFFNISDKSIVDVFYDTYGIADFYGIDEENQRIFLPRNKYFAIKGSVDSVPVIGNGMAFGLTDGTTNYGARTYSALSGAAPVIGGNTAVYGTMLPNNITSGSQLTSSAFGITTDPEKSGIIADTSNVVQPNENKYLYYCVGNTEVTQAITNVTEITTSENDTIPLFTGMYFDFKPNNVSWLKAGEQQNSGGIYKTCYDTLVEIVNGVNNYDLKVINKTDMVSGVVYDEYWVLDQDNLTFTTPLTISSRSYESIAPVVGNGMTLGLTDGTNNYGVQTVSGGGTTGFLGFYEGNYGQPVGNIGDNYSKTTNYQSHGITTNPEKSGIEAHLVENTTAQLYFKVANAVQNLELLDAGEVLEGLANIIPDNSSLISGYVLPSNRYVDLELGANGSTYTAPANGWAVLSAKLTSGKHISIYNPVTKIGATAMFNTSSGYMQGFVNVPCKKGDIFAIYHNSPTELITFRFIYAEGEV